MRSQNCGFVVVKGPRACLGGQVGALCEFHLDCVHAFVWLAVVACCPTAFETAVGDRGIAGRRVADRLRCYFNSRSAGGAHVCANVEVGQSAVKQERNARTDGMTIIQNRDTVHITHALKFGLQCGVIGRVIGGLARFHRRLIGGIDPNVMAVKICQRHKASGVLAGIKGHARRVAVGVNDVAVEGGADRRGPR